MNLIALRHKKFVKDLTLAKTRIIRYRRPWSKLRKHVNFMLDFEHSTGQERQLLDERGMFVLARHVFPTPALSIEQFSWLSDGDKRVQTSRLV